MTSRTRSVAASALADQLAAATTDATRVMSGIAAYLDADLSVEMPPGPARALAARLADRVLTGRLGICDHLTGGPQPAVWLPYRPGRVRCLPCTEKVSRRVTGTVEDRTCDACRKRRAGGIFSGAAMLPGALIDVPPLLTAGGPILILFGLCGSCRRTGTP